MLAEDSRHLSKRQKILPLKATSVARMVVFTQFSGLKFSCVVWKEPRWYQHMQQVVSWEKNPELQGPESFIMGSVLEWATVLTIQDSVQPASLLLSLLSKATHCKASLKKQVPLLKNCTETRDNQVYGCVPTPPRRSRTVLPSPHPKVYCS